jgi:ubiquinone/menaquinone biosynthesis C-methylase UbiE
VIEKPEGSGETWWGGDTKVPLSGSDADRRRDRILAALRSCDIEISPGASVLDFGCGDGSLVDSFERAGYDAWGAETNLAYLRERVMAIDPVSGTTPFTDHSFDLVLSYTVLEHVSGDQSAQFDEFRRLVRIDGATAHFFPPRLGLVETHTMVPLASVIRWYAWLLVWARLGVRAPHQRGLNARTVAKQNERFLAERTNYLSRRRYLQLASERFANVAFAEEAFVRGQHPAIGRVLSMVPGFWTVYSAVRFRVLLASRPRQ